MKVSVIVNPVSGRGANHARAVRRAAMAEAYLRARGADVHVVITERPQHAHGLAALALAGGADVVAAWGGDGTMNEVASALAGSPAALGLIPGGSGNGLARDLGIPLVAAAALDVLVDGHDRRIDGGVLDGRPFFNVAGIGLDARIAGAFQTQGDRGLLGYVVRTTRAIFTATGTRCTISSGGTRRETDALIVAFANSRQYGNNLLIAPEARLDDGAIDIVVIPNRSLPWLLRHIPRLLAGRIHRVPGVALLRSAEALVEAAAPVAYHVDGEPHLGGTRIRLEIRPGTLRVRVPVHPVMPG
jgi:YegS/Rv2252/BmrU family lipid kinase